MKKLSSVLLFIAIASSSIAQDNEQNQDRANRKVKKRPVAVTITSRKIEVKEIGYPSTGGSLKGATKISEEKWRKIELKFRLMAAGAKEIQWIDELEINWKMIITVNNKKPKSKNDLLPILLEKKVVYTNVVVDPRKELVVNLFINPVMYERYLRGKVNDKQISFQVGFEADGAEMYVNKKKLPLFLNSGAEVIKKSYWNLPPSKFQKLSNRKLFILNKEESPFQYVSLNGFLDIKKQDK
ncbi:MAG: hypothetical protein KAG98_03910 [Lentisphaeria bacterium]|nr:hypothetical protein [Lentisphaeria bacterium]